MTTLFDAQGSALGICRCSEYAKNSSGETSIFQIVSNRPLLYGRGLCALARARGPLPPLWLGPMAEPAEADGAAPKRKRRRMSERLGSRRCRPAFAPGGGMDEMDALAQAVLRAYQQCVGYL